MTRPAVRVLLPVGLLALSQVLWFSLPFGLQAFGLAPRLDALSFEFRTYYFIWIAAAHSLQYLWVTAYYARQSGHWQGQAPHYLPETENPAAIEALVTWVARLLDLHPHTSRFAEAIREFRTRCDQAVARDRATREHVRKLEQEYDAGADEERPPLPEGEIDSDSLIKELEEFLRKQGEGGTGGTGA